MINRVSNALASIGHRCSEFASYFGDVQRSRCRVSARCAGGPSLEEAAGDYRAMVHTRLAGWSFNGGGA